MSGLARPGWDEIVADGMQLSVPQVRDWARGTDPELIYARVADRPVPKVREEVRRLYERRIAAPVQPRIHGGFAFMLQRIGGARLSAPLRAVAPAEGPMPLPEGDEVGRAMEEYLADLAQRCEPCPTNPALAKALGLTSGAQAAWVLRRLREHRRIRWEPAAIGAPRVIEVVPVGLATRGWW